MAQGKNIIVSAAPRGVRLSGYISGTPKPGTIMQIKAATEPVSGKYTWEAFNRDADGNHGLMAVLLPDYKQGKTETEAFVSGDFGDLYVPLAGEEINLLMLDVAGTGDDWAIADLIIVDDGTGKGIATTGTPEREPFICLETVTDPTADHLLHVMYTGS